MNVKLFSMSIVLIVFLLAACSEGNKTIDSTTTTEVLQTSEENNASLESNPITALPLFSMQDVNGNILNLQAFRGKKVFLNLWASWCPPCRQEMPSIEKLAQSVDTSKVAFVMLSLDDNFDKAKKFARNQQLKLPVFYPAENLPTLFKVQSIPSTFIFNEIGELIRRIDGGDDYNTDDYRAMLK